MAELTGYYNSNSFYDALQNSGIINEVAPQPPQHVLDQIGGSYDASKYDWNPDTFSLVDKSTGGSYSFDRWDPSTGSDVVLPYGYTGGDQGYGGGGEPIGSPYAGFGDAFHFAAGENPFFGFGDGRDIFMSSDPNAIDAYQHDAQTRSLQGIGKVGALVGGAALGGALGGNSGITASSQDFNALTGVAGASETAADLGTLISSGMGPQAVLGAGTGAGIGAGIGGFLGKYGSLIGDGVGALLGYDAAGNAVDAQVEAQNNALNLARENRDLLLNMNQPYYQAGVDAVGKLRDLTGLNPGADVSALVQADPSYQFRLNESMRMLENGAAAKGGLLSGQFGRDALQLGGQYASQEYTNIYNRLANIAGMGQVANSQAGATVNNYTNNAMNSYGMQGFANASGYTARGGLLMDLASAMGNFDWTKIGKRP